MAGILPFGAMFIELFFIFSVSPRSQGVLLLSKWWLDPTLSNIFINVCVSPPTGHLGESVLLPLWLSVPGLHHPGGVLLSDQHCHGLFPAVCRGKRSGYLLLFSAAHHPPAVKQASHWWLKATLCFSILSLSLSSPSGLQMVVENLPGVRRLRLLRPDLRHLLLCQQGNSQKMTLSFLHSNILLLWWYWTCWWCNNDCIYCVALISINANAVWMQLKIRAMAQRPCSNILTVTLYAQLYQVTVIGRLDLFP